MECILGTRVGPFRLGMTLYEAIVATKQSVSESIHISSTAQTKGYILFQDKSRGIQLLFDPKTQLLLVIQVLSCSICNLTVYGRSIRSAAATHIHQTLGPTKFATYDKEDCSFLLGYSGGCVRVQIPVEEREQFLSWSQTSSPSSGPANQPADVEYLPLTSNDGSSFVAHSIFIYFPQATQSNTYTLREILSKHRIHMQSRTQTADPITIPIYTSLSLEHSNDDRSNKLKNVDDTRKQSIETTDTTSSHKEQEDSTIQTKSTDTALHKQQEDATSSHSEPKDTTKYSEQEETTKHSKQKDTTIQNETGKTDIVQTTNTSMISRILSSKGYWDPPHTLFDVHMYCVQKDQLHWSTYIDIYHPRISLKNRMLHSRNVLQDVLSIYGQPDDRSVRMLSPLSKLTDKAASLSTASDYYWYTYASMGVAFAIDPKTSYIRGLSAWTNSLRHPQFGMAAKSRIRLAFLPLDTSEWKTMDVSSDSAMDVQSCCSNILPTTSNVSKYISQSSHNTSPPITVVCHQYGPLMIEMIDTDEIASIFLWLV